MYNTNIRGGLDYGLARVGGSRVRFRGPVPDLEAGYLVCLGGTETFGRFLPDPWPVRLADRLEAPLMNLGQVHAGLDLYLQDPEVLRVVQGARLCVLQVMGAQNMSNRLYSVHPRRNDRFVKASDALIQLYPDVDFSQIVFTGALMNTLHDTSPERFEIVVREMQVAWVSRMRHLLTNLPRKVQLLWMSNAPPVENARLQVIPPVRDPAFVTREMLDAIGARVAGLYEVIELPDQHSTTGMVFSEFDAPVARDMLGVAAHDRAAEGLAEVLRAKWAAASDPRG